MGLEAKVQTKLILISIVGIFLLKEVFIVMISDAIVALRLFAGGGTLSKIAAYHGISYQKPQFPVLTIIFVKWHLNT